MTQYNQYNTYGAAPATPQTQNQQAEGQAYSWDDMITNDQPEFILLKEGEYDFTVEKFERGQFNGSEKMSACPVAILHIGIDAPEGHVTIRHQLLLHSRMEGRLSEFFASIGQKKKGQQLRMNWNLVTGSRGRCKVGHREYNGNQYNDIKRFLPAPGYDQAVPVNTGYKAGTF